jgi:hypothetical protein
LDMSLLRFGYSLLEVGISSLTELLIFGDEMFKLIGWLFSLFII